MNSEDHVNFDRLVFIHDKENLENSLTRYHRTSFQRLNEMSEYEENNEKLSTEKLQELREKYNHLNPIEKIGALSEQIQAIYQSYDLGKISPEEMILTLRRLGLTCTRRLDELMSKKCFDLTFHELLMVLSNYLQHSLAQSFLRFIVLGFEGFG